MAETPGERGVLGRVFVTVEAPNHVADIRHSKLPCESMLVDAGLDFSSVPEVERWLDVCLARPAYGRMRDMAGV